MPRTKKTSTEPAITPAEPTSGAPIEKPKRGGSRKKKEPPVLPSTADQALSGPPTAASMPGVVSATAAPTPKPKAPEKKQPKKKKADVSADADEDAPIVFASPKIDTSKDEETKRRIREDLGTNFLVEAVPGSGKTYNLIKRLVALVKNDVKIERIAAITFTRKAAEELRLKFRDALEDELRTGSDKTNQLSKALEAFEDGYVGTIHGFCGRLLREFPVEAKFDPAFEEIEPEADEAFTAQRWNTYLETQPELIQTFTNLRVPINDHEFMLAIYKAMDNQVDTTYPVTSAPTPELEPMLVEGKNALHHLAGLKPQAFIETTKEDGENEGSETATVRNQAELDLWERIDRCQRNLAQLRVKPTIDEFLKAFSRWPGEDDGPALNTVADVEKYKEAKKIWGKTGFATRLKEFRTAYAQSLYGQILPHVTEFCQQTREERLKQGRVNFGDLLSGAVDLLKNNPEIRRLCAARFDRLLIDEFQDTDPLQAQLAFLLTANEQTSRESNWLKCVPRPGSLFLVGDPKQAIYGFRRADIRMYLEVKQKLIDSGGEILTLGTNRRSVKPICDFVNTAFGAVFAELHTGALENVSFASMAPHEEKAASNQPGVFALDVPYSGHTDAPSDMRKNEYPAVIQTIATLVRSGHPAIDNGVPIAPKDILVLADKNDYLVPIAVGLEENGIPVSLSGGGRELASRAHAPFTWLYWLLRSISDPTEPGVLYSVLAGPFFGLSDTEIWEYQTPATAEEQPLALIAPIPPEKRETTTGRALRKIRYYQRLVQVSSPGSAFRQIVRSIAFDVFLLRDKDGFLKMRFLRDVEKLFDGHLFREALDMMVTWLDDWPNQSRPSEPGHVQLMSIHKAKGLEAPVVFVVGIDKGRRTGMGSLFIERNPDGTANGHLTFRYTFGQGKRQIAESTEIERLKKEANLDEQAEELRLQYVATTRAERTLIISRAIWHAMPAWNAKEKVSKLTLSTPLCKELKKFVNALPAAPFAPACEEPKPWTGTTKVEAIASEEVNSLMEDLVVLPTAHSELLPELDTNLQQTWRSFDRGRREWLNRSAEAKVLLKRVTEVTEDREKSRQVFRRGTGGGKHFGTALHRALDLALQARLKGPGPNPELDLIYKQVLEENPLLKESGRLRLPRDVQTAMQSALWVEALNSKECLTEAPLLIQAKDRAKLLPNVQGGRELILDGVIDLIYRIDGGWKLIDFKTDHVEDDAHLQQLADYHAPQLRLYEKLWQQQTGEPVVQVALYFVSIDKVVQVGRQ